MRGFSAGLKERILSEAEKAEVNKFLQGIYQCNGFNQWFGNLPNQSQQDLQKDGAAISCYAFEKIKEASVGEKSKDKCTVVLATVKGDIHDIGKNIVKLLLENYGFNTVDLGKDVPPEEILDKVIKLKSPLCGLSALMTTTVPSMEETIRLIKEKASWCKVIVGGAVLNQEYADLIGADKYAKDAMETVRYSEEINNKLRKD